MEDELKYLLCISSLIILYTLFFCKTDIIENMDDTTTTSTPCVDPLIEDCFCIRVNDDNICVNRDEISSDGTISDAEQTRLENLYPDIIFSMAGRRFTFGSTNVTFSNPYTPSVYTRQTVHRTVTGSGSNTFVTTGSQDGTTTTNNNVNNTTTTPVVINQESDDMMIYYIIGCVLMLVGGGVALFMINQNKEGLRKAGKIAKKNIKANRANKAKKSAPVDPDFD